MPSHIRSYLEHYPKIADDAYIDPLSIIIGDASLDSLVSVWPFAVIRADVNHISIGKRSNIQDHTMLHVSHRNEKKPKGSPMFIGEDVTIGHHATLHGCTIGNRVLVGIQTIILDDAIIEDDVMIGAGSLVPPGKVLNSGFLYIGSPVRQVRKLSPEELAFLPYSSEHYVRVMKNYKNSQ